MPFPSFVAPPIIGPEPPPVNPPAVTPSRPAILVQSHINRTVAVRLRQKHRSLVLRAPIAPRIPTTSTQVVVHASSDSRLRRRLGNANGIVARPVGVLGVRREKTVKPIFVRAIGSRMQRAAHRRHRALILHGSSASSAAPRRALLRSVKLQRRLRARHRILILKATLTPAAPLQRVRLGRVRSRQRLLLARHQAFLWRAPIAPTAFVTQETIKHIYLRSVARLTRQRVRLTRNQPLILRAPGTLGVPRAKTVKAIYLHGIGRYTQLARKRRHKALVLRAPLPVAIPLGRILLRPVDRTVSGKRRPRRFALILRPPWTGVPRAKTIKPVFVHGVTRYVQLARRRRKLVLILRSKGGVPAAGVTQKTVIPIILHGVPRKLSMLRRHHRLALLRAPLAAAPRGGRIVLHPARRAGRPRRHRIVLLRSRFEAFRKTGKPLLVSQAIRGRMVARLRKRHAQILRASTTTQRRTTKPLLIRAARRRQIGLMRRHFVRILRPKPIRVQPLRGRFVLRSSNARVVRRARLARHRPLILRSRGGAAAGTVLRRACVSIAVRALSFIGITVRGATTVSAGAREQVHVEGGERAATDVASDARAQSSVDTELRDCD